MIKFEIGKGYEQEKIIIDRHEDILVIGKNGGSLDLEIILEKEGASANIYGIIIGKDAHSYDIKTSHGVTISTIDNEHMYYLMSRGISDKKSRDLLVTGFINDIFQKFPD